MNLYLVLSEELLDYPVDDWPAPYRIWELVVARNPSQARYLAWKDDLAQQHRWGYNIREIPRIQVRIRRKDVKGPARIVSREYRSNDSAWFLDKHQREWEESEP